MSTHLSDWMSWVGGVDLVALTQPGLAMPNVIVHVARMVHTPVGSAPSGMVFWQPDPQAAPVVMGFVSTKPEVGAYFGPKIFAGTPFENAPVLTATIEIEETGTLAKARICVGDFEIQTELSGFGPTQLVERDVSLMSPFHQQGLEASASSARLLVNGEVVPLIIPPVGISGGPAAVWSPCGLYAR